MQVCEHSLDPAQAELWISVTAEHLTPTTELRGQLAGPRCLYAATVEVGYPLRPFTRCAEGLECLAAARRDSRTESVGTRVSIRLPGDGRTMARRRAVRSGAQYSAVCGR